jgi:hypothetical protein
MQRLKKIYTKVFFVTHLATSAHRYTPLANIGLKPLRILLALIGCLLFQFTSAQPTITSFSPFEITGPGTITITGTGFSTTPSDNTVTFNGATLSVTAATTTQLTVDISADVPSGLKSIHVTVAGQPQSATSPSSFFLKGQFTGQSSQTGDVGSTLTVTGTNFDPATFTATFDGGITSTITSITPTSATLIIPTGVQASSFLFLSFGGGGVNILFIITNQLSITGFSPTTAAAGTSVTITGSGFSLYPNLNQVEFNGVLATVITSSYGSITVIVPPNTTSGPITIRIPDNSGITHYTSSSGNFSITCPTPQSIPVTGSFTLNSPLLNNDNQWYKDGVAIPATGSTYSVTTSGVYTLNNNGCFLDELLVVDPYALNANTSVGNVYISPSGMLTAPNSSNTFNVTGNFTNNGSFSANGGTVNFAGLASQTIGGTSTTSFNNIANNNTSGGLSVTGTVALSGALSLGTSSLFDADGPSGSGVFTLTSSASNDASIAELTNPDNFSGKVTVERYIPSLLYWHSLSFPVTDLLVSDIQPSFPVTGHFPSGGSTRIDGGFNEAESFYFWSSTSQSWGGIGWLGTAANATAISNTLGYSAWAYAGSAEGISPGNKIIMSQKTIAKGSVNIPLSAGWNFIPNPYPAPLDWNKFKTRAGLTGMAYLQANSGNGAVLYATTNGTTCANCGVTNFTNSTWKGEIAMGQSFWVQAAASATLTLTESDKTTTKTVFAGRDQEVQPSFIRVTLKSAGKSDDAILLFEQRAKQTYTQGVDGDKKKNDGYINLSSFKRDSTKTLVFNYLPFLGCQQVDSVGLALSGLSAGTHTLNFTQLDQFSLGYKIKLRDKYLRVEKEITNGFEYAFTTSQAPRSKGSSRFEVVFQNLLETPVVSSQGMELKSIKLPNYQWKLDGVNLPGATQQSYTATKSGQYTVESTNSGCKVESKPVVMVVTSVNKGDTDDEIYVYPNPTHGELTVKLPLNSTEQHYVATLLNTNGQFVQNMLLPQGGESTVQLDVPLGIYFIKLVYGSTVRTFKIVKL